jgi:hypothetical protein
MVPAVLAPAALRLPAHIKDTISIFKRKFLFKRKLPTWAERLFAQYGKVKLICPNCNIRMELFEFSHKKYGVYSYK